MIPPSVSIIVNVFNGERYIEECIRSILELQIDRPIEIIVVDDASTDRTPDIVRSIADLRLRYVCLDRNVGAASAINYALGLVRGEFVARIDYDDRYHPNFLSDSIGALELEADAAFVCGSARMIDQEGAPGEIVGPGDYGEMPGCSDRFRSMLTTHFVTAPTILGRAAHWRRVLPIPEGMDFCDWYMNLKMAEAAPVVVIDKVVADYRIHSMNMHSTKVKSGMGERVTFDVLDHFLNQSQRSSELEGEARRIRALHYADWGNKYFGAHMNGDALRCYREALRRFPRLYWTGGFMRRMAGVLVGRRRYEQIKTWMRVGREAVTSR